MPLDIDGVPYFSATEAAAAAGVSRQTLWRWRREGRVPLGSIFRDRQVIFTPGEVDQVRQYATRVETPDRPSLDQLKLFNGAV